MEVFDSAPTHKENELSYITYCICRISGVLEKARRKEQSDKKRKPERK
jgi:arginyl-tRNA synthetase